MKFQLLDIIPFSANPLTGEQVSPADRFAQTVEAAVRAEEFGFDAVAVGERATEVIPVLRRELPTTLRTDADPAGSRSAGSQGAPAREMATLVGAVS